MTDDTKKPSAFDIAAEPTPRPNQGASTPEAGSTSAAVPAADRFASGVEQAFADAVSGAAQRRQYQQQLAAAQGDPAAQESVADQSLGLAMGTVQGPPAVKPNKLGLYSKLEETVRNKFPEKVSAEHVPGLLRDLRADELAAHNIPAFLEGKPKFTKQELLDHLKENQLQIKEVVKGEITPEDNAAGIYADKGSDPKFAEYTLPGGENYQERLLTLPETKNAALDATIAQKEAQYKALSDQISGATKNIIAEGGDWSTANSTAMERGMIARDALEARTALGTELANLKQAKRSGDTNYKSSHYDEPNILAHTRSNERVDTEGKRLLHLEEVQSDWHQAGRKQGYKSAKENTPRWTTARDAETKKWEIIDPEGKVETRYSADDQQGAEAYVNHKNSQIGTAVNSVPDAPFKKTWHELAIKRSLHDAVNRGVDKLSWTTGEQQAARYDLSKHIDRIEYKPSKTAPGSFRVTAIEKNGRSLGSGEQVMTAEQIASNFGKDVADRISKAEGASAADGYKHLSGDGLSVGGEGMKGFYDKIIPDYLNKFAKKYGVKVGTSEIPTVGKGNSADLKLLNDLGVKPKGKSTVKVHSLELTPEMKADIMNNGLPMFAHGGLVQKFADGGQVQADGMNTPVSDVPEGLDAFVASATSPTQAPPTPGAPDDTAPAGLNEFIEPEMKEAVYGSTGQMVRTGVEGALDAASFGTAGAATDALGISTPEERLARAETNPMTRGVGQAGGLLASTLIPGAGPANVLARVGEAGAAAVGMAAPATTLAKIGSAAVKGLIENAVFQGTDEVAKMIMKDPAQSVESAITNVGLSGLIGGGVSGGLGTISPLWSAASGGKLGKLLEAITEKAGGREGAMIPEAMQTAVRAAGMESMAPEIKAGLSEIPEVRQMFKTLEQSDITAPGLKFQETYKGFRQQSADSLVEALGATPDRVAKLPSELSKYETGKAIGKTLADEYERTMAPLAKEFETIKARFEHADLIPDQKVPGSHDFSTGQSIPDTIIPGTASEIGEKLGQLVEKEGWLSFPDSETMKTVNQVYKALPQLKTVKDLNKFVTRVGQETASTLPFGQQTPLSRAGSLIKNVLKDAEESVALQRLGEDAPELLERFHAARDGFKAQAALKEALDDRLKVGGSVSGFAKGLRNMADSDGEMLLNRINGKGDADGLALLAKSFPETASMVKQWHTDNILKTAAGKATKYGESINANELLRQIEKMEPELRNFALSPEQQQRIAAMTQVVDELEKMPHNFSNTARTMDKLNKWGPSGAVGMATMLLGHNPAMALALGYVTKLLSKDVPDATRLGLLKFLGSDKPMQAEGFKSMVEFISATMKGQNKLARASKEVFKAGREVLPATMMPKDADREKLDKHLKALQKNEAGLLNVGGKTGHYMPEHGAAIGQVSARVVGFLNQLRPEPKRNAPLDPIQEPSDFDKDQYNRALDIAEQPLVIAQSIKDGTLTSDDVLALQAMYPQLANQLRQKLTNDMIEHINKGEEIDYDTRISLSLFLGQPLDSTMTPEAISTAQLPQITKQIEQDNAERAPAKTSKLSKVAQQAQTATQARELEKSQGK